MAVNTGKCNPPDKRGSYANMRITVNRATSLMVFESEPLDANDELYYENEQTFDIENGYHLSGNIDDDQPQTGRSTRYSKFNFFANWLYFW